MGDFVKCGDQHHGARKKRYRFFSVLKRAVAIAFQNTHQTVVREAALPSAGVVAVEKLPELQIQLIAERPYAVFLKMGHRHCRALPVLSGIYIACI